MYVCMYVCIYRSPHLVGNFFRVEDIKMQMEKITTKADEGRQKIKLET